MKLVNISEKLILFHIFSANEVILLCSVTGLSQGLHRRGLISFVWYYVMVIALIRYIRHIILAGFITIKLFQSTMVYIDVSSYNTHSLS